MNRTEITPRYVKYIPTSLEEGVLYISLEYATATHLCACGCGNPVVTPLNRIGWELKFHGKVSLNPSIGNFNLPCQSHYFIKENRVIWLDSRVGRKPNKKKSAFSLRRLFSKTKRKLMFFCN